MSDVESCDRCAIVSVLAELALTADTSDLDVYLQWYTDDAVWEAHGIDGGVSGVRRGREEIRVAAEQRRASGLQGPGTATRHTLSTTAIEFESPVVATSRSVFAFYGSTTGTPELLSMGCYDDRLHRTADGWRLAHRVITLG